MRGIRWTVLLVLLLVSLLLAFGAAYFVVVSQNPKASAKPLYGPGDFISQTK